MVRAKVFRSAAWIAAIASAMGCGESSGPDDSGTGCDAGLTDCSGVCVSVTSDPLHCGACGVSCGSGACVANSCEPFGSGGGTGAGGAASGGESTGGWTSGGTGAGGPAVGGQPAGGAATGGVFTGGSPSGGGPSGGGSDTGGAGTGGTGGGLACDTSWDTHPDRGDGLALTPPLGWNSWNAFHENIDEQQIRQIADAMVDTGLRDAGYIYLNLDDKWMDDDGRDGSGNLVGDSVRFPSGMAALADYVHERGLKFGLYGDRGTETCAHYNANTPCESGSYGRETQDAQTFASWGVDYLKFDNCSPAPGRDGDQEQEQDYRAMGDALKASGRPIVFSICAWDGKPWMPEVGHLWRSTFDIGPCFSGCDEWYRNIDEIIDENNETPDWAGPGHWNDPDMMVIGHSALSYEENVAHFSMWAVMAAPIILGNDLRSLSSEILGILTNEEVLAVNQDPAGIQGTRVAKNGDLEVWMKPLCSHDGPEKAVVLLNRSGGTANITVSLGDIGISGAASVRDLWSHTDLGSFDTSFSADVPSHGVAVLKIVAE